MVGKGATELSEEDRVEIEKFLKMGYKIGGIAQILGRSHSGIKLEISRNGTKETYNAATAHQAAIARKEAGRRKKEKNLTPQQIEEINKLLKDNLSINKICKLSGVTYHRVTSYLNRNNLTSTPMHYTGFDMRIRALEAQMGIVLEKIKEMYEQN